MNKHHPYQSLPDYSFWRKAISEVAPKDVDPVVHSLFKISPSDRVVTAGSCFAQHIARRLASEGFNYLVTEQAHPVVADVAGPEFSYGLFSARYGNIYTARQLVQLLWRAYDLLVAAEPPWRNTAGAWIDPFRPQIQPGGFASETEFQLDRIQHYLAVRLAVEAADVFIFTLGLTEAWVSSEDGACFPICPGVAGGEFDSKKYKFINFCVAEVVDDLRQAITFIRTRNPKVKFIFTVSPVPLVATAENRSVLEATTYSKAVLRVAAETIKNQFDSVAYFPSYEIITGNFNRGGYFANDLRSVTEAGVDHVMRLFMRHYSVKPEDGVPLEPTGNTHIQHSSSENSSVVAAVAQVMCDEELLDSGLNK